MHQRSVSNEVCVSQITGAFLEIGHKYILDNAIYAVNLPYKRRLAITRMMSNVNELERMASDTLLTAFDRVVHEIVGILLPDSLSRFRKTAAYTKCVDILSQIKN